MIEVPVLTMRSNSQTWTSAVVHRVSTDTPDRQKEDLDQSTSELTVTSDPRVCVKTRGGPNHDKTTKVKCGHPKTKSPKSYTERHVSQPTRTCMCVTDRKSPP